MTRIALTLAAGLALAACSAATGPIGVARLGSNPVLDGGTYDSGGGVTVAVELREWQGRTVVCGVWAQSERQSVLTQGVEHTLLGSGSVYLDGEALVRGLNFMPEVPPMADYAGQEARCMATSRPWREGDEARRPVIRIPRQTVYVDADEGGTIIVNFRQTGPGA
ncbi:MAG: hypothetical protein H5U15_07135 [Roseovarius sp.]|jgi:hypothetical protein|nr:hypothetical protein [Roseovarius sp.]